MMMEFLANAIVGISAAFSGMWVLFQILERRSHFLWRLLGVLGIAIVQGANTDSQYDINSAYDCRVNIALLSM